MLYEHNYYDFNFKMNINKTAISWRCLAIYKLVTYVQ